MLIRLSSKVSKNTEALLRDVVWKDQEPEAAFRLLLEWGSLAAAVVATTATEPHTSALREFITKSLAQCRMLNSLACSLTHVRQRKKAAQG